jgi:hypothetical protein
MTAAPVDEQPINASVCLNLIRAAHPWKQGYGVLDPHGVQTTVRTTLLFMPVYQDVYGEVRRWKVLRRTSRNLEYKPARCSSIVVDKRAIELHDLRAG